MLINPVGFLGKISDHLVLAIPAAMVMGFLYGTAADPRYLKGMIPVFTFMMVYPMMVTLQYQKVFEKCAYKTQGLTQVLNLAVIPLVGFIIGMIFFHDTPYMALGLLLAAVIPTSGMTVSWTSFAKGNVEVAVKMMIIGLSLGSILAPFYVKLLLGAQVGVDILQVLKKILQIVFVPMAAGFLTRQGLQKLYGPARFRDRIRPVFPPLATLGVLGIVFTAVALRSRMIAQNPLSLLKIIVPVLLFYLVISALGAFAGLKLLPREDAVALYYGTTLRNLSISLAVAINAFGPEGSSAALVIVAAFIVQTQMAAWSVKFMDRVMERAPS